MKGGNSGTPLPMMLLLVVCFVSTCAAAACPWADTGLTKWSTLTGSFTRAGADVVIAANQRILLDESPGVVFRSISISGELVIDNKDLQLQANWIRLNSGGKFIAGAEEKACKITKKVVLTFYGNRTTGNDMGTDPFDNTALGSKGMAATTGSTLELHGYSDGPTWTRLAKTAKVGDTSIELEEAVKWTAGDVIVIASTDFGEIKTSAFVPTAWSSVSWYRGFNFPEQTEKVTVKSVSGRVVTFNQPLNFTHWGQGVQKAEVGLITRRIVFTGEEESKDIEFGGHLIIRKCDSVHIEGIEVTLFGQKGVLARYPVHFHFLHDVIGNGIYFRDSSIHTTFQRCLVVHDTHGLLIKDIVGYDTQGHMFFLEDGGEKMNTFDHVLGLVARPVASEERLYGIKTQIIPTDNSPAIFWITNPNNTFVNCAAVGGRFGFWFLMPTNPIGAAATAKLYDPSYNPRRVNLLEFHDNVAHSNSDTGFEWDAYLTATGTTEEGSYAPSIRPFFYNLLAYKCRQFGFWGKSSMEYRNITSMDNRRGLMVNGATLVYDSLFIGETDNIGTPRVGFARSFPDGGGGNTSKLCGHESYDNGGPQYSWNNVFVNFTWFPNRAAAALCPLQTGPFMLDTKNRLMNLTFVDSNRVHVGLPRTGDNEYGWTVLDIDGSITQREGGGWIVSNSPHLITPACTYEETWAAYSCPPNDAGFVQVLLVDQTTDRASNIAVNGSDISAAIPPNTRVTRIVFYDQEDPTKEGKGIGARMNCANGTEDACFQFMNNVVPRKFYTVRFTLNEFFIRTPRHLSVNMHSASPGDYVYISIPYPASAKPFNVSTSFAATTPLTAVNSLDEVVAGKNFYYDDATEHLYVLLANPNTGYTTRQLFSDYNSASPTVHIRAACTTCNPTESKLKTIPKPPATPSFVENKYFAKLETCQVLEANKPSTGVGSAYFWFYPATRELHYNVYHDLTGKVTLVELGVGDYGTSDYVISTRTFKTTSSPLRSIFILSDQQWGLLIQGKLYVNVITTERPNGHLRGQIQYQGTRASAARPPAQSTVDACKPAGNPLVVFDDASNANFVEAISHGSDYTNETVTNEDFRCGNASIKISMQRGSFYFNLVSRRFFTLDRDVYKFLEFYVKLLPGYGEMSFYVAITFNNTAPRIRVSPTSVSNYFIDERSGWARVKMPLADFTNLPEGAFNITRITWTLLDVVNREYFFIDEVRFIEDRTEATKEPFNQNAVVTYNANICTAATTGSDNGSGDVTTTGSQPSATTAGANGDTTTGGVPPGSTVGESNQIASATALCASFVVVVLAILATVA